MEPCPLVFEPIFREKVWGGRNLAALLGKALPGEGPIGESWEVADLDNGQSVVARGPAKGKTLGELVREWGPALLGRARLVDGRFPLLIKFLDAEQNLSVQVHPAPAGARDGWGDDGGVGGGDQGSAICETRGEGEGSGAGARQARSEGDGSGAELGAKEGERNRASVKHEAWHILRAAPGAVIYRGLGPGVTAAAAAEAARRDPAAIVPLLRAHPVKAGQTYYLPSGTVHALGAGVVVAEVQTPSDVTHRLYDWGRTRPGGDAGLHVEQGLAAIRTDVDPAAGERRSHVAGIFTTVSRVVECPYFVIEKVRFLAGMEQEIPYAELVAWVVLEGRGEIAYGRGGVETFVKGDVVVLPAGLKDGRLRTREDCVWLEVTVPAASDLAAYPRAGSAYLRAREGTADAPMGVNIVRGK